MDSLHLTSMLIVQVNQGDAKAKDELFRRVESRLQRLARRMFREFPGLQGWTEIEDILQRAQMRLLAALDKVVPHNTRQFFGLAARHVRLELIDVVRKFRKSRQMWLSMPRYEEDSTIGARALEPQDSRDQDANLERWETFHREVELLPTLEREVVSLIFYHGWPKTEVAALLQVSEREVRTCWNEALKRIYDKLNEAA